jgi:hypothetical protein
MNEAERKAEAARLMSAPSEPIKPRQRLRISGAELKDGDQITRSGRYGGRVRGIVKIATRANSIVFLEAPTLPEEDVAFRSGDSIEVLREPS